jgi:hypothetical protein
VAEDDQRGVGENFPVHRQRVAQPLSNRKRTSVADGVLISARRVALRAIFSRA